MGRGWCAGLGTDVPDATSGFRAYNREAALGLVVVSRFTYTLESLIQAGKSLTAVTHVPGRDQRQDPSRLFGSMWTYIRRNMLAIFRIYTSWEPLFVFSALAATAASPVRSPHGARSSGTGW